MEIAVLIEPSPAGYRATTQSPVTVSAEGGTESAAMAALTVAIRQRLQNGAKIRTLTLQGSETLDEVFARMRSNPLNAEFDQAIVDYRKVANAVEDVD